MATHWEPLSPQIIKAGIGVQSNAVKVTAGAVELASARIPEWASFVSVTSAAATSWIKLPVPVLGNILYIQEESATGFELRPEAVTQYINGTLCDANKELACASGVWTLVMICTVGWSAGKWTQFFLDEDGSLDAGWTPD